MHGDAVILKQNIFLLTFWCESLCYRYLLEGVVLSTGGCCFSILFFLSIVLQISILHALFVRITYELEGMEKYFFFFGVSILATDICWKIRYSPLEVIS